MMERRKEKRVNGAAVRRITGRIRPGYAVEVVNLSPSGALVEGQRPFPPGRRVDVHLAEDGLRVLIRALITHCSVALMDAESITYRAGLLFEERVESRERQTPGVYSMPEVDPPFVSTNEQSLPGFMYRAGEPAQESGERP
jgi:hypothetical protein